MSPPNRTQQLWLNPLQVRDLPEPVKGSSDNGINYHIFNGKVHDAVRIDLNFRAGRVYSAMPLVAKTTWKMLKEESKKYKGPKFEAQLDYYDSYFEATTTKGLASVSLLPSEKMPVACCLPCPV